MFFENSLIIKTVVILTKQISIVTDSCPYGDNDKFEVTFRNSDRQEIDIIWYNEQGNEQLMESNLPPENERTFLTYFTHQWIFKRSGNKERLKATANGVSAQVFEGCRFMAKPDKRIQITISEGNKIVILICLFCIKYLFIFRCNYVFVFLLILM